MPTTDKFNRILVTSALPYANGPIHIGHIAGAYLPADIYCRYQRLKGRDILYICGSDEHGVAIMIKARQEGKSPQEIVDAIHPAIKSSFEKFGMSFDYYGRTSSGTHSATTTEFFQTLNEKGTFVTRTEAQLFDPEAGIFLADRFITGTCPNCSFENAYGDQCENCGRSLSPSELLNPRSTLTESTPELRETTHWFLPLGDFQDRLEAWIGSHPEWKPNVLGQVKSWLADGLRDRAITRDVPWGVPVPKQDALDEGIDASGKVFYVWFDAPIGYISATREWAASTGNADEWKKYWQQEDTKLVHFIGKDNIVFHCLMFPAMLMAHGDYVLPDNVPANEFLNLEGQKLSTSRGWAIWLEDYLDDFDPDLLRYVLASTFPEAKDSDFSWKDFQARVNNELADVLGNFVNRTMTFAHRFFDGAVPALNNPSATDLEIIHQLHESPNTVGEAYENYKFRDGVFQTINLARLGNRYFNDTEPWKTAKSDLEKCANTIHVSIQICAALSILVEPVMPFMAARLKKMVGLVDGDSTWPTSGQVLLQEGAQLGQPEILVNKIEDDQIEIQIAKLAEATSSANTAEDSTGQDFAAQLPEVEYDDFAKLDLRVGTILTAARVRGTDRLMQLEINLGFETRQIVSGIAEHFSADDLVSKSVVVVANLKARKIRGVVSKGMVLTAENPDGSLRLVTSNGQNGSKVS